MKNKSIFENAIVLIRCRSDTNPLAKALNLCQGSQGISSNQQTKKHLVEKSQSNSPLGLRIFSKGENNGIQDD